MINAYQIWICKYLCCVVDDVDEHTVELQQFDLQLKVTSMASFVSLRTSEV